jgi:hypothetical protein
MKKILTLGFLGATTSLMAMYAESASLYKDIRVMGMGGADVAVGSYSSAVFSNPAGLTNIRKKDGFVVDLIGLGINGSEKFKDFIEDIDDATKSDDSTTATTKVLQKYSGEHFHQGFDAYMSVSKNSNAFSWTIGLLAATDLNFMAHGNGSSNAELLETTTRAYGGAVLGVAKPYITKIGELDIGMSFKYITQKSYEGTLGISELTSGDDNVADKFQNRYEKESSGFGIDLGVIYKPYANNYWHPAVGFSILNIGSMNMDDNYGGQPMTLNIGASITPEFKYIDKFVLAVDYVDLLNANKLRIYNYNDNGDTVSYNDYDSTSFIKHFKVGTSIGLYDSRWFSTTLRAGIYQGSYTAGLDLDILLLKLNLATYEEEVGDNTTSIKDRRFMAKIAIGW